MQIQSSICHDLFIVYPTHKLNSKQKEKLLSLKQITTITPIDGQWRLPPYSPPILHSPPLTPHLKTIAIITHIANMTTKTSHLTHGTKPIIIIRKHGPHISLTFKMVVTKVIIRISGRNTLPPQLIYVPLPAAHIPTILTI